MEEATRTLRANKALDGRPCVACGAPLHLGEEATVCGACSGAHHQSCWVKRGGCATPGCANEPLKQMDAPPAQGSDTGKSTCPGCRREVIREAELCPYCDAILSPDGVYRGPKTNAPGAAASLTYGIIGLFFFGIVLGWVAMSKSKQAKRLIASSPRYGGEGMATAGYVLGVIDVVLFAVFLVYKIGMIR